jgi:O-antigen ligase
MKLDARGWGIVALGAGLPITFAVEALGFRTGHIAIDIFVWPFLVGALVLTGPKVWLGLRRDTVARILLAFTVVSALSLPIGIAIYHNIVGARSFGYQVALMLNFAAGYLILRRLDDVDLFIRAFVASIGAIALLLSIYLLQAGVLGSVHSFHNSDALKTAIYGWPNGFSVLIAAALVMCLYVIATVDSRLVRRAYTALAIGLTACLILTFSKTGWLVMVIALWLLWLRFWSTRRQLLLLAGVVVSSLALLFVSNESFRMQVFTLGTVDERLRFVAIVFRHVNPVILLTGSGSQSFEALLAPFASEQVVPGLSVGEISAHDEFINVLIKTGLLGLILFVAALVMIMLRTRRLTRSADSRVAHLARYSYAASWAVIVSLFAIDELHYWPVGAFFWMLAGAMVHLIQPSEQHEPLIRPIETEATRAGETRAGQISRSP